IDGSFPIVSTSNGGISEVAIQPDGKILIAGTFQNVAGFVYGRIARLNPDGTIDLTFNTNGIGANNQINDIKLLPDGKILIAGIFTQYNGVPKQRVARLNSDGTLDNSFTYTPLGTGTIINDLDVLPNGKIAVVGSLLGT